MVSFAESPTPAPRAFMVVVYRRVARIDFDGATHRAIIDAVKYATPDLSTTERALGLITVARTIRNGMANNHVHFVWLNDSALIVATTPDIIESRSRWLQEKIAHELGSSSITADPYTND